MRSGRHRRPSRGAVCARRCWSGLAVARCAAARLAAARRSAARHAARGRSVCRAALCAYSSRHGPCAVRRRRRTTPACRAVRSLVKPCSSLCCRSALGQTPPPVARRCARTAVLIRLRRRSPCRLTPCRARRSDGGAHGAGPVAPSRGRGAGAAARGPRTSRGGSPDRARRSLPAGRGCRRRHCGCTLQTPATCSWTL